MKYDFPVLKTIDDVLPAIKHREEFIVAEREGHVVINYVVEMADTFKLTECGAGAIRRECRGLIFGSDEKLIRRPFHKFANIGQWEETMPDKIDFSQPHVIMDKADGSMIAPFMVDEEIIWGTKMGDTDVAKQAKGFVKGNPNYAVFVADMIHRGFTPIFEYVGPNNRIVLDYEEEDMILLAIRHNETGRYVNSIYGEAQ